MAKFIKKPVAIEAVEWTGKNLHEISKFCKGDAYIEETCDTGDVLVIKTLEGQHMATVGDYIIKGVKGEHYPCKPDIFRKTYYTEAEYAALQPVINSNPEIYQERIAR